MNAETLPHFTALGFNDERISAVLSVLGLNTEYKALAECLQAEVIGEKADELVKGCLDAVARCQSFSLIAEQIGVERLEQILISHLRSFGRNFDAAEYFENRLALAADCARANIPLGTLHLPYFIVQQALVSSLYESSAYSGDTRALLDVVLKVTSLDLYLTAEGYRLPKLDELEEDLDRLREEASRLQQKHWTDELTGVMSYARLMDALHYQVERALRKGHEQAPLCLIMSDLDFFKKINDTYGHLVGDLVLRHVAQRIQSATRDFDMIGRFGGEEFVIVMANTDLDLAKVIAERIRTAVMRAPFHVKQFNIDVTISLGVAMQRPDERKESLLERADAAMYEAKRRGRNCVVAADDLRKNE